MYTVGSLFTGIGGIDLAFVRAGFSIAFQVEIDPYCRAVLAKHAPEYWPDAQVFEDVRNVGRTNLPAVDVLAGGFPCQDISVAGKRAGIKEGTRSGLWIEFARVIGELRPSVVFLENVAAITARDGTRVIADLAALRYDAEWAIVPASATGAPHQRERWFCVAYCQDGGADLADAFSGRQCGSGHELGKDGSDRQPDTSDQRDWTGSRAVAEISNQDDRTGVGLADARSLRCYSRWTKQPLSGVGSRAGMVNASGAGQQERHTPAKPGFAGHAAGRPDSQWAAGQTQSRLGGIFNGLSVRLDNIRKLSDWPVGPGEQQHEWEAPRVATGIKNRTNQLKALGNAVVPQVVQPIAEAIYEALEAQR